MKTNDRDKERREKVMAGMEKVWVKLIAFKKQKGTEIVVMKDGKIYRYKPE
ncbi:MAG: hypothetical protein ACKOYP_13380 [Bacteroidota bacterium]